MNPGSIRTNAFWSGMLTLMVLGVTASLPAQQYQDALTMELSVVAKEILGIVQAKGGGSVAVGQISTSTDIRGTVGPQIQCALAAQLRRVDVQVDPKNYRYEIKGDYLATIDKETGLLGVKLLFRLIDRNIGEAIIERPAGRFVFGAETVPRMLGLTVHSNPGSDVEELSAVFKQAMQKSGASVVGCSVRADPSSPYAVELVVKRGDDWTACAFEQDDRGCPIAKLTTGDIIAIRLRNDSDFAAAVNLTIDGINTLSTAREPKSEYWLVPAKDQLLVQGWWISDRELHEFNLTERPEIDSTNPRFVSARGQRMITAAFSAAWRDDSDRPKDEPQTRCTGPVVAAVESNSPTLQAIYQIGAVRDVITFLIDGEIANPLSKLDETHSETESEEKSVPQPRLAKNLRGLRDGPVHIEILKRTDTGYEPQFHQTESYGSKEVALGHNEPFAFKVVNESDQEMAVRLSFDGVNVLTFSERGRIFDYIVVRANGYSVVTGWAKGQDIIPFVPRKLPESDRVIVDQAIPRIHVTFAETWTNGSNVERNSSAAQVEYRNTDSGQKPVRWIGPVLKILEADYSEFR